METQEIELNDIGSITEKEFKEKVIDQGLNLSSDSQINHCINQVYFILKRDGKINLTDPDYVKLSETKSMKTLRNYSPIEYSIAFGYNSKEFLDIGRFLQTYEINFEIQKNLEPLIQGIKDNSAHYDGRRLATADGKASLHLSNNEIVFQQENEEIKFSNIEPYEEIKREYTSLENSQKKKKESLLKEIYAMAFKA